MSELNIQEHNGSQRLEARQAFFSPCKWSNANSPGKLNRLDILDEEDAKEQDPVRVGDLVSVNYAVPAYRQFLSLASVSRPQYERKG